MATSDGYLIPSRYWAWLGHPLAVRAWLWLAACGIAGLYLHKAWHWFDDPTDAPPERCRADGNNGHCQIDFGGQWVMGRMIVSGYGRQLYHRQRQWEVVRAGFPAEEEPLATRAEAVWPRGQRRLASADESLRHDAEALMSWFMGRDPPEWATAGGAVAAGLAMGPFVPPGHAAAVLMAGCHTVTPELVATLERPAIGGPLYPPLHGLLYAPLGLIDRPQTAYRVMQVVAAGMVFVAGLGVSVLSRGRIPWSAATLVLFLFPGTRAGLDLGQNPTLSLAIAVWGWALLTRGYPVAGGAVWGLFAFKPVWGLAFFLVPVLARRWRFAAGMVVSGSTLVAATLPVVGLATWFDWLAVGREAAATYTVNQNWILLSRDLHSLPRRILHDFSRPEAERDTPLARGLAWGLWGTVLAVTAVVYLGWGVPRRPTGVGTAFLFFGAWLTCYRFMYYDALLLAAGCAVLFADLAPFRRASVFTLGPPRPVGPRPWSWPRASPPVIGSGPRTVGYVASFPVTILAWLLVHETFISGWALSATVAFGRWNSVTTAADGSTGWKPATLEGDTGLYYPWETGLALLMWAWCGVRLACGAERRRPDPARP